MGVYSSINGESEVPDTIGANQGKAIVAKMQSSKPRPIPITHISMEKQIEDTKE